MNHTVSVVLWCLVPSVAVLASVVVFYEKRVAFYKKKSALYRTRVGCLRVSIAAGIVETNRIAAALKEEISRCYHELITDKKGLAGAQINVDRWKMKFLVVKEEYDETVQELERLIQASVLLKRFQSLVELVARVRARSSAR